MSHPPVKPVNLLSKLSILLFILVSCMAPAFIFASDDPDTAAGALIYTGIITIVCIILWTVIFFIVLQTNEARRLTRALAIIVAIPFCIGLLAFIPCSAGEGCMGYILFLFLITIPSIFFVFHTAAGLIMANLYKTGKIKNIGAILTGISALALLFMFILR